MTDKQRMREQFEAHYKKLYPDGDMGRDAQGDYTNGLAILQWDMWQFAYLARDAEVQALREALESVHYRASRWEVLPTVEAHQSVLRDIGEDARAALAGGETGETE